MKVHLTNGRTLLIEAEVLRRVGNHLFFEDSQGNDIDSLQVAVVESVDLDTGEQAVRDERMAVTSAASESVESTRTDPLQTCEYCGYASVKCRNVLWPQEKKCCPDCSCSNPEYHRGWQDGRRSATSAETPRRLRDLIYAALDAADVVMGRLPTLAESPQFVRYTHARAELRDYLTAEQEKTG